MRYGGCYTELLCCDCGGGGVGGKTIKMWWQWENNRNVVAVVYSFTIYEAVLKKKLSVGSMWDRCRGRCWVAVGSM